jgi:hypothetical protein
LVINTCTALSELKWILIQAAEKDRNEKAIATESRL